MSTMRALVTGGAGFLGSHLCERLLGSGFAVVCLDSFLTGSDSKLKHIRQEPRLRVVRHDVTQPLPDLGPLDRIYNLACPASPVHYQHNPVHTLKTSVFGAVHVLDAARATGARVLQASTSEVYGDPVEHPQKESYRGNVNPIGPRACYDEGKRAAETLFFDYYRRFGVPIRVARIFNTYGPRMDAKDGRVVSNFIVQALAQEPITLYGNGQQTRSFCFVDDLIDGLVTLMEAPDSATGPLNLGNPGEFTILQLAQTVVRMTASNSTIQMGPLPEDDPRQRRPDIGLAGALLGWAPKVPLEEGLARTIAYFRATL